MISGNIEAGNQNEQFHKPLVSSISSHQEQFNPQPTVPVAASSASVEQHHFMHWDQSVAAINDASDRASIFDHVSPHDHDSSQKANYMHPNPGGSSGDTDHIAAVSTVHAWTPAVAAGAVFPPISPVPSGPQVLHFTNPFFLIPFSLHFFVRCVDMLFCSLILPLSRILPLLGFLHQSLGVFLGLTFVPLFHLLVHLLA